MTGAAKPSDDRTTPLAADGDDEGDSRRPLLKRALSAIGLAKSPSKEAADGPAVTPPTLPHDDSVRQQVLLGNVQRMGEMRVSDAMVPRADVIAVAIESGFDEVVAAFRQEGHSRLPVYHDTLDDADGFIHVKDVFMVSGLIEKSAPAEEFSVRPHLRRILTVPPSMRCGVLLQKMQADRVHMALVIDEYGGVDGLVTIEDLLELIVGDIEDEHDATAEAGWTQQSDNVYRADARAYLDEFEQETGVRLLDPEKLDDVDTLGGLVFMLCNRVPARGEVIRHPDGHEFEILDADPRRIKRLLVTLTLPEVSDAQLAADLQAAQ